MPTVPRLPEELYLEVTNRCNSQCQTCIRTFHTREPDRDLTLAEFGGLVDQVPELRRAVLHGIGEPLLNRNLPAMIAYLKQRENPPQVLFNSNAILLSAALQQALMEAGLDEFRVSVDAAHAILYEQIRGVNGFERMVANVKAFAQLVAHEDGGPRLSLWFTALQKNLSELPGIVRLASQLGVREVYVQRLVHYGEGLALEEQAIYRGLRDSEEQCLHDAEALAAQLGVSLRASGATTPRESLKGSIGERPWAECHRPWRLMYITANGNVLPCCLSPYATRDYDRLILGNAFTTPLGEIWNGSAYRRFREALASDAPWEACDRCGVEWSL